MTRTLTLLALAALTVAPATAQTPGWTVAPSGMTRQLDALTATWKPQADGDEVYGITITGCGDTPPHRAEDIIHFEDEPLDERTDAAHEAMESLIADAVSECALAEGLAERAMSGFDNAYGQLLKIKK